MAAKIKILEVPVDLLRPKVRVRRDVGDLLALVDSIKEYGPVSYTHLTLPTN